MAKIGRPLEVEIAESELELEAAIKGALTASSKERLQMLYWLKTGQVKSRQEIAQRLVRDEATITRWVRKYKDGGISRLLQVKKAPGKTPLMNEEVLFKLKQRLKDPQGFHSYVEIQQWISQEFGIEIAYKTVYQIVHYQLKAKLKVPRPQSIKQHPESQSHFKKNCH